MLAWNSHSKSKANLIRVSNGRGRCERGVQREFCSLQTSLMIGLLFGEVKRLSVLQRVALVACAGAIALLANFVRAVFLVMVAATENLSEVSRWHDIAGYGIIAFVFVATLALAYLLGRGKGNNSVVAGVSPAKMQLQPTRLPLQFSGWYCAGGPLLALVYRDWNDRMATDPSRTQSHQRHTLERTVARTSDELS